MCHYNLVEPIEFYNFASNANGSCCVGVAPCPNVSLMGAFSDLVAMATDVKSTMSLKICLILKVQDFAYTGIYDFLYPFLHFWCLCVEASNCINNLSPFRIATSW